MAEYYAKSVTSLPLLLLHKMSGLGVNIETRDKPAKLSKLPNLKNPKGGGLKDNTVLHLSQNYFLNY